MEELIRSIQESGGEAKEIPTSSAEIFHLEIKMDGQTYQVYTTGIHFLLVYSHPFYKNETDEEFETVDALVKFLEDLEKSRQVLKNQYNLTK